VGDAYFAQKSYNRMRELCERDGTTLLFVTHDVYSAVRLCGRVIWIDRGRILMDGDGPSVVKAYEDSIRQQEEHRLRLKNIHRLKEIAETQSTSRLQHVVFEIASRNGRPQPGPVYMSEARLLVNRRPMASLQIARGEFDGIGSHLLLEGTAWGDPLDHEGRTCRPMLNYGSAFHKVAGTFAVPADMIADPAAAALTCEVEYAAPAGCELTVRLFVGEQQVELGLIESSGGEWTTWSGALSSSGGTDQVASVNTTGVHGTGTFVIHRAGFVATDGKEVTRLTYGEPATLEIEYSIHDPALRERAHVVVALHKDGVQDVCRYIARDLLFDSALRPSGTIRLGIQNLVLTDGLYSVTIMIAREGYFDIKQTVFYTINPDVYCCVSRLFDFTVAGSGAIGSGTVVVPDVRWAIAGDESDETLDLDLSSTLAQDFPVEFPAAFGAVERVLDTVRGVDLDGLARRSPALRGFDWANYLRCSTVRMAHAAGALRRRGIAGGRLLDYGSYFGNTALMFRALGFDVHAVDAYDDYRGLLDGPEALLRESGVLVRSFADVGADLHSLAADTFDVIVCLGVIEHIPHTPRLFVEGLNRVLRRGGVLLLDTPNLAYLYKRRQLERGESVWPPLSAQYYTEPPYEGHHREYTADELVWIVSQIGHVDAELELYNYSIYQLRKLAGQDLANFRETALDPERREYITVSSRKPRAGESLTSRQPANWRDCFVETEQLWVDRMSRRGHRESGPSTLSRVEGPAIVDGGVKR